MSEASFKNAIMREAVFSKAYAVKSDFSGAVQPIAQPHPLVPRQATRKAKSLSQLRLIGPERPTSKVFVTSE
eukprot:scaffold204924_cov41-Prasinocladus_malaysianus.AAC.1